MVCSSQSWSDETSPAITFLEPAYTVANASLSNQVRGYRVSANVKNLTARNKYAGALSANMIAVGHPHTLVVNKVFDF